MIQYQFKNSSTGRKLQFWARDAAHAWAQLKIKSSQAEWNYGHWHYA